MPLSRPSPRLAALDGLRLLAALAVAGYHYTTSWRLDGVHPPQHFLPTGSRVAVYGFLGVELFFLISGFVICMSGWGRCLGDFFVSRAGRLYPAYWAAVVVTAVVVTALPVTGGVPGTQGPPSLMEIAVNLTMLQQPLGVASVDTVYWTLWVELRFYLLFAVVAGPGLTYRRAVLFCTGWTTVAVVAPVARNPVVDMIAIPDFACYFVAGMAMCLMRRFGPTPLLWAIVGFSWLISLHHVARRLADLNPGFTVPSWPGLLLITVGYGVMLAIALGWTDRIAWRWLPVAGALTYPFYLLHQRVGYSLMRTAYHHTDLPPWALVVGATVVLLAAAWSVHRLVERPLGPRLRAALHAGVAATRVDPRPAPAGEPQPSSDRSEPAEPPVPVRPPRRDALSPAGAGTPRAAR